jgi:hypothetical protein
MKVRKIVISLIYIMLQGSAHADWVYWGETSEGKFFVDPSTAKEKPIPQIWTMMNLNITDSNGKRSQSTLIQAKCNTEQFRVMSMNFHSDEMGTGKVLFTDARNTNLEWIFPPPSSVISRLVNTMCKK